MSEKIQWMVTTPLYHIGEQVSHLSESITNRYPNVPWFQIAGLRNRLVHDYDETDWTIMSGIVFDDLPIFIRDVKEILRQLP